MTLSAGSLNKRIRIQRHDKRQDEAGQLIDRWVDVATVWANVRYLNGVESLKSDAPISVSKVSIRIRYRTGLTSDMRALLGDTIFDIRSVLPDEARREFVDLACETGGNRG